MHCMAYYIFLKSLKSLDEFWKNPHVKIPPKSPSTIFQSLSIIKNQILIQKRIFPSHSAQRPAGPPGLLARPAPLAPPFSCRPRTRSAHPGLRGLGVFCRKPSLLRVCAARRRRLLPLSPPRGPHLSVLSSPPRRPTPVGISPRRRSPVPLPRASDAPELLQPSLITLPP
jgi:hypothetical protein